ncbi:MAG: hypothetical protein V4461_11150 [Pseudomonadota bacterium]|tara:strand:- start:3803 stop:4303 length:501 start_codon:yes stop_codon:yes gene_type:complete
MKRRDVRHTPDALSIKAATEALIVAVGGPDKAAGYARPGRRFYSDYVRANVDAFIPADAIVDLEKRAVGSAGWPQVTRELARQQGFVLVKVPDPSAVTADLHRHAGDHAKEASDVTSRILLAASRGKLTPRLIEDHDLVRECREAVDAAVRLSALIEAIAGEGGAA